jgi:hypothetical protein
MQTPASIVPQFDQGLQEGNHLIVEQRALNQAELQDFANLL